MHAILPTFLPLLSLVAFVQASNKGGIAITLEKCYTKAGSSSLKHVPTSTQASTIQLNSPVVVKSTATSTVTPAPTTTTVTAMSTTVVTTTNTAMTDTFTATSTPSTIITSTSTAIVTTTDTSTITSTTTQGDGTSTIAAPAGYIPLATQLASMGDTYAKRRALPTSHANAGSLLARGNKKHGSGGSKCAKSYPQSVKCKVLVEKIAYQVTTVPARQTATVTAAPATSTTTSTTITTSTSTVALPDVSTTVTTAAPTTTITATAQTTTTTGTIITTTATATVQVVPTATAFAACQADNIISQVNQQYVDYISFDGAQETSQMTSATSQLDCCNQCQTLSCQYFAFSTSQGNQCYLITDPEVPAPYSIYTSASITDVSGAQYIGNGVNGQPDGVTTE